MLPSVGGHKGLTYRPDIDGLRALAVFLVILFHLDTPVSGGFVGVDVFFVISGYLISGVVLSDISSGRFTLAGFYERRIRRILPALLAMMYVTTILAWHCLVPTDLKAYGRSQLAALFSVSNFFFWRQTGYFEDASTLKPLLHTWSLGVEEQFYIVFPIFIVVVYRFFRERMRQIIWALALLSFAASAIIVRRDPASAFYLAPLRAWELLLGTLISQKYLPSIDSKATRNIASLSGFILILASSLYYTEGGATPTPFPGLAALAPCLGAALIIAAGETGTSLIGAILSWRPVVFLGLISYSLYLWHWPLLVFQRTNSLLFTPARLTPATKALFVAITILVAMLSWLFVEQPFRTGRLRPARRPLLQISGAAVAVLALVSVALFARSGFPRRFPPAAQQAIAFTKYSHDAMTRYGTCFLNQRKKLYDFPRDLCLTQHPGRKSILLAGDSHAAALYPALTSIFPDRDILQANVARCPPLSTNQPNHPPLCERLNALLFKNYLQTHHVDLVILEARWDAEDLDGLAQTADFAHEHSIPILIIGPTIEYDMQLPQLIATSIRSGHLERIQQQRLTEPERLDQLMANLSATRWHVPYVSIFKDLCAADCPIYAPSGAPLLFDNNHFTRDGALLLVKTMVANKQIE